MLGESIYGRYRQYYGLDFTLPADGYYGEDIIEITKEIIDEVGEVSSYYQTGSCRLL